MTNGQRSTGGCANIFSKSLKYPYLSFSAFEVVEFKVEVKGRSRAHPCGQNVANQRRSCSADFMPGKEKGSVCYECELVVCLLMICLIEQANNLAQSTRSTV